MYKADLFEALRILDVIVRGAWHKTGIQEYRCNTCGGIGSYPRSIEHAQDCLVKAGEHLINTYRQQLENNEVD